MNVEDLHPCPICEAVLMGPADVHMDWHRRNGTDDTGPPSINDPDVEVRYIGPGNDLRDDMRWLSHRGYTAVVAIGVGLVFGRGNEPAKVAGIGTTLTWDGVSVRVWTS